MVNDDANIQVTVTHPDGWVIHRRLADALADIIHRLDDTDQKLATHWKAISDLRASTPPHPGLHQVAQAFDVPSELIDPDNTPTIITTGELDEIMALLTSWQHWAQQYRNDHYDWPDDLHQLLLRTMAAIDIRQARSNTP